ncbi:MAG: FAD-dependent 5-carboxymethylaminomethyl-2-thiouridine(34) oxidoreductase MnmC, partial [Polaromonas sp.]
GLNFLVTWAAWKADPLRPRLLHFVSTEAFPASATDMLRSAQTHPELLPFARELQRQLWGLLPGFHRLVLESGQVLLTLCVGDAKAMLRESWFEADSVYLDGFSPQRNPDIWDVHTFKAVARCCRRGARIATWTVARSVRDALGQCGFIVEKVPGSPPKRDNLQGEYNPVWAPKTTRAAPQRRAASRCIVIGAGLAGAAVAASLARRGWQVTVLDAAPGPASGASGLPAGVIAPHVSPDDSVLSRLSRSGIRAMLQQADELLQAGSDWHATGVLEHCVEHSRKRPAAWLADQPLADAAHDWTRTATPEQLARCALPLATRALWHVQGGWINPARLVQAWLAAPGVNWRGNAAASRLRRKGGKWQVLDEAGQELASAELVVLAAGYATRALAVTAGVERPLALQAIRGQVSWALHKPGAADALPDFPVNGHGSLIPAVPLAEGLAWITGSSFERDNISSQSCPDDDAHNLGKLQTLLPSLASGLQASLINGQINSWAGVRCATPSRLPALGPLESPDLWVCSGMGSRGLSFAALCAELLAARLHGEPLPVELRLANALLPAYASKP